MNNFMQPFRKKFYLTLWVTLCFQVSVLASEIKSIELKNLGSFKTEFIKLEPSQTIEGNALIGRFVYKTGAGYKVALPFDVQQILFLVTNGQSVKKGDVIATIDGVDVHHFIDEMDAAKSMYLVSKKHFEATSNTVDTRTFKNTQWLEINKSFIIAKLNYEHFSHLENVIKVDDNDIISIVSPEDGLINLNDLATDVLYEVIPNASLLVKSYLPASNINQLSALTSDMNSCTLSMIDLEPIVKDYQQVVWSKPSKECEFKLGQSIALTPMYSAQGFKVSREAIFELDNQNYVAVKRGEKLDFERVSIVGKLGDKLIIHSNNLAIQEQVLISSVSIAQGVFMGLGE